MEENTKSTLTNKDLMKANTILYVTNEMSNSYERLQGMNFCITMAPFLKKFYKGNEEGYKEALVRHMEFFNAESSIGALIHGMTLSLEEKKAAGATIPSEAIVGLKTGLMGPLAGIGDSLIRATGKSTIMALACTFAITGNPLGVLIMMLYPLLIFVVEYNMLKLGYRLGREAVGKILGSGLLNKVIVASGTMGMFMMGALSSSYVSLSTSLQFKLANAADPIVIQDILDNIAPGLLPLLAVFGIYFYIKKSGKYAYLVWIIIISSFILSFLGVLG